jgi:hypothetical protein
VNDGVVPPIVYDARRNRSQPPTEMYCEVVVVAVVNADPRLRHESDDPPSEEVCSCTASVGEVPDAAVTANFIRTVPLSPSSCALVVPVAVVAPDAFNVTALPRVRCLDAVS